MASAEAFSSVLTYDAWIIVILSFVLTGIVLWLVARISPYEQVPRVSEEVFTLANSYWFIFSCFFRGSNYTPQVKREI